MKLGKINNKKIKWIFVKKINDLKLYISKDVIYGIQWNDSNRATKFANTTVSNFLNFYFSINYLTPDESKRLVKHPELGVPIFIPSYEEIESLKNKKAKIIKEFNSDVNHIGKNGETSYYLRDKSTFSKSNYTCIDENGKFDSEGADIVHGGIIGVRPCILIKK